MCNFESFGCAETARLNNEEEDGIKFNVNWAIQGALCGAVGLFATASPAFSQTPPPPSEEAKQVEALVNKAAAEVESKGKASFAEFRRENSEWFMATLICSSTTCI